MLSELYPEPQVLIENEAKTLNFLKDNPYFCQEHQQFANDAHMVLGQIGCQRSFQFGSYLDLTHSDRPMRLFLEGRAVPTGPKSKAYDEITYGLVVCRRRERRLAILRKYHFDVALPRGKSRQKKFLFHLQYCGGLSPYLGQQGLTEGQIVPMHYRLSEPRLFFWPMSLALLLDGVLHEFPDIKSAKFRQTGEWRDIVRMNESLLLGPFCQKCADIIFDRPRQRQLLADVFDVK